MATRLLASLLVTFTLFLGESFAQGTFLLRETLQPGMQFAVKARVQIVEGTLFPPVEKGKASSEPIKVTGDGAMEYQESVLGFGPDQLVNKTLRLCQRMEVKRNLGGQPQENVLRTGVRRLVVLREKMAKAPFSPDGPLLWSEIDLVRTDIFSPLLVGMLPGREVSLNGTWQAANSAVQELTGIEKIEQGGLECTLTSTVSQGNRQLVRVDFQGTVRGLNEDGPTRHDLRGYYHYDLGSQHLVYLTLNGTQVLLGPDGKERGKIEGRLALQREPLQGVAELNPANLTGVALDPTEENTLLLFDNPDLGVKFLYPRRWRVAAIRAGQLQLDTPDGQGLLLTLVPKSGIPTGAAYLKESREWVERERGKVKDVVQPRTLSTIPALEFFSLEVDLASQARQLDYYILRQEGGGVLVAASLSAQQDSHKTRLEVKKLAESVTLTRRIDNP